MCLQISSGSPNRNLGARRRSFPHPTSRWGVTQDQGLPSRVNLIEPIRMPLSAGVKLGPYEILAPIGAGGMGEVYRATDTRLHRTIAIKILPSDKVADAERK